MNIIETSDDPVVVKHQHSMLIKDMDELIKSQGWQRVVAFIDDEINGVMTVLDKATTGDLALKAAAAFSAFRSIRNLPNNTKMMSLQRIQELEKENPEEKPVTRRQRLP